MSKMKQQSQNGFMTVTLLAMITVFSILMIGVLEIINLNVSTVANNITSQKAFNISEAGINYYLWHLSHNTSDYKDGGTIPTTPNPTLGYGPYVHDYKDDFGVKLGTYTLWINPQGGGSTIVTIRAIGQVVGSKITRTIDAKIGSPSFASYGVVSDNALWFGSTETASGPVHSNSGVRMDGASSTDVTAANATYKPLVQNGGCNTSSCSHPGVWCDSTVITPINCNTRPKSDWQYPVPTVDFNQITGSLCALKKTAFNNDSSTAALATGASPCTQTPTTRTAAYLPQRSSVGAYSQSKGYLIELNTDGTYNLSQVNAETDTASSYSTALTTVSLATNIAMPSSGVIFAEDNVWVRSNPTYHGRVTIGAGRLATSNNAEIVIAGGLLYSVKTGADAIGLVAENNITLAPYAPPQNGGFNFEVDAATIAQSGSVNYPLNYRSATSAYTKGWTASNQTFLFYGSVASRLDWTWTWDLGTGSCSGSCGSPATNPSNSHLIDGILNNTTQYDYNLLYTPPPSFPITGTYNVLSWHEVITTP